MQMWYRINCFLLKETAQHTKHGFKIKIFKNNNCFNTDMKKKLILLYY
jgi:hypothetical protein